MEKSRMIFPISCCLWHHLDDPAHSGFLIGGTPQWDNLFIVICAIIIFWMKRRKMFQFGTGLTDILLPEKDIE